MGVASFDSTSPLRQAFKDDKDNYYTPERTYCAIRVPQVEGNAKMRGRIVAGTVNQGEARRLERTCLETLAPVYKLLSPKGRRNWVDKGLRGYAVYDLRGGFQVSYR